MILCVSISVKHTHTLTHILAHLCGFSTDVKIKQLARQPGTTASGGVCRVVGQGEECVSKPLRVSTQRLTREDDDTMFVCV